MHPVSVKGVLIVEGRVVLLRNERNEWELPGGRVDSGETHQQTLVREFREELSIDIDPQYVIDSYVFEVIPSKYVSIVTYGCRLRGEFKPALSEEHTAFGLHAVADLESIVLPTGYARSIKSWSQHAQS